MKKLSLFTLFAAMITLIFSGCEDSELLPVKDIEGIYVGTISDSDALKKTGYLKTENEAYAEVSKIGNGKIQVHIYDISNDVKVMLDYYEHTDSLYVCYTGDDFQNMYGHMLGQGHMQGGMMGDRQTHESSWEHHLYDEHKEGDEHFGGFNMLNHTFTYRFTRMEDGLTHNLIFQGEK